MGCRSTINGLSQGQNVDLNAGENCATAQTTLDQISAELSSCTLDTDCEYIQRVSLDLVNRADSVTVYRIGGDREPDAVNASQYGDLQKTELSIALDAVKSACQYAVYSSIAWQWNSQPAPICNQGKCSKPLSNP